MIGCGLYYHFIAEVNPLFLCVEYKFRNYLALKIQLLNSAFYIWTLLWRALGYFCPEKMAPTILDSMQKLMLQS